MLESDSNESGDRRSDKDAEVECYRIWVLLTDWPPQTLYSSSFGKAAEHPACFYSRSEPLTGWRNMC